MNVIDLYDKFTTTWEKIRASLLSHAIVIGGLWFIGFAPPLPEFSVDDLAALQSQPVYQMVEGVGLVALLSLALALLICAYAVLLRELGGLLIAGVVLLFPPVISLSGSRRMIPREALFTIAGTLEGGTYEARDLEQQINKLVSVYALSRPEELRELLGSQKDIQRDASTHLRNATVFTVAWLTASWWLAEGSPLLLAIDDVFWSGLGVLVLYMILARARLVFGFRLVLALSAQAVASLAGKDEAYRDRLKAARSNPGPYMRLVHSFLEEEREDRAPSLSAYFRYLLDLPAPGPKGDRGAEVRKEGPLRSAYRELRSFGWDSDFNRDYEDPCWLVRYAAWRVSRFLDAIWNLVRGVLMMLGLWRV